MVSAHGLVKRFGDVHALKGLDLAVEKGSVLGLLGPNGAGKTTAVSILTTLLEPDEGTVRLGTNLEIAALDQKRSFDPDEMLKDLRLLLRE